MITLAARCSIARRHPPALRPILRDGRPNFNCTLADSDCTDVFNDDLAIMHLQYSMQWDSLAHVGGLFDADGDGVAERVFFNGFRAGAEIVGSTEGSGAGLIGTESTSRAHALGIENMAAHGVQGRGVMIDLRAHFGDEHKSVGYDDLMAVMEADHVEIDPGDMVCFHTGLEQRIFDMKREPRSEGAARQLHGARRTRPTAVELDFVERRGRADRRQLRGRSFSRNAER